jgi:glycine/D-amino acid oxidase-like deaminating enzyme
MAATKVAKKSSKIAWLDTEKVEEISTMGTTKTTAQVHPYKFTNALIDDAKKRGVKVRCGQGVKSLSWDDSKNRLIGVVLDDDSIIECDAAIVCMGPWSAELPIKSNRSQRGRLPIIAARAHSIVLKPKRDVPAQALFCSMQAGRKFYDPEVNLFKSILSMLCSGY